MKISKYIELLRFYLVDRIDGVEKSLESTLLDEVDNITSSIISAIFSVYISFEMINAAGLCGVVFKVLSVVIFWFAIKYLLLKPVIKCLRTVSEIRKCRKNILTHDEAKKLVDQFDHIACDYIIFARDYLRKYEHHPDSGPEKDFYIIEAFYYYRKALAVTQKVVSQAGLCVNNKDKCNVIALYRLNNAYLSLNDLHTGLEKFLLVKDSPFPQDFIVEFKDSTKVLEAIGLSITNNTSKEKEQTSSTSH